MSLPLLQTTLDVVQGGTLTRVLQGVNEDGTTPTTFLASDTLTATVWQAQAEAMIFAPTATWFNAPLCQITVTISQVQSALLSVDTTYNLQVLATRAGVTYYVAWCYLRCLPAAGSQVAASPPDLVLASFVIPLLQGLDLGTSQIEQIPTGTTIASAAVRSWCNRNFTQQTYTKEFMVEADGYLRLDEIPVNQVLRVQGSPRTALAVSNTATNVQDAWIVPNYTGTVGAWGGQTLTGITLNWLISGVQSSSVLTFTANETFTTLGTAINAVGSGWTATADSTLGLWPVTEMVGPYAVQGAIGDGVKFEVYSKTIQILRWHPDDGQLTGMLYVGRQYAGESPRWGPGWDDFGDVVPSSSKVKVTYNAGFAVIPYEVQLATVELLKAYLERLRTDLILQSETAGKYAYELAIDLLAALPRHVLTGLSRYRLHNA